MNNNTHPITKLEKDQFASAMKKGLGRAMIHVSHYGLDNVDDLVLDACIHNYCYDIQVEPNRSGWLFQMFGKSDRYSKFSEIILDRLKTETDLYNLAQLCGIAKKMAMNGDNNAREGLRERVLEIAKTATSDDSVGEGAWIELEGTNGFLELARIYGQRLLINPEDIVPDYIVHLGETENELKDILFRFAEKEVEIKAYKDYLEGKGVFKIRSERVAMDATQKSERHERIRKEYNLDSILKEAKRKVGNSPGRYITFGRYATPKELEEVYNQLFIEADKDVLLRLLWVFRRTPLPQLSEMFFDWAKGTDNKLRESSIIALAQLSDQQIHELAISKVREGELLGADNNVLDLFLKNFEINDIQIITQALALALLKPEPKDAHSIGFSLLDLGEKHAMVELAEALKWAYENTPCSNCRFRIVEQLFKWQKLDDTMLYESQFDANEDIRNFAEEHLTGLHK